MTIMRIESLVFGVENLEESVRFYEDSGLKIFESNSDHCVLITPEKQTIVIKYIGDKSLPPAMEEGSTLREIIWGMDNQKAVDAILADLSTDRETRKDEFGVVHSFDETGFGLGFRVSREEKLPDEAQQTYNMLRKVNRWNDPVIVAGNSRPMRLIHLALNIPKEGHQEAIDFYVNRLGFRATDILKDAGTFMHCEGDVEHHNFFLCHRPDVSGFNHCALEIRNFDELVQAGNHMISRHWKESRTLGRHLVGSNLYRFFHSPAGGRLEFASDMDKMNKKFETRYHEKTPGHHIWTMKTHGKAGV